MSVLLASLKHYKSLTVDDSTSNGGGMSENEAVSGVDNNIWPDVSSSQRAAGITGRYRKMFAQIWEDNVADSVTDNFLYNFKPTPGDDYIVMFAGTALDTKATLSESRIFGSGILKTTVTAGGGTLIVTVENAAMTGIFADGDKIIISDKTTADAVSGNEEPHVINGTPSVSGLDVTLTLTGTLTNGYTAGASTQIMSGLEVATVDATTGTLVVTSTSGTVDESSYPVTPNLKGTITETVTFTFTDATNFTAVGSVSGTLGSGVIGSDFAPTHTARSAEYFTVASDMWTGTWANGDTLVMPIVAANIPYWLKQVVPAGADSLSSNLNSTVWDCEA